MWYRVFGRSDVEIQPASLLEHAHNVGLPVQAHFRGDDQGWFEAELMRDDLSLTLSRYLVAEEGIRKELNSWAAWIELQEDNPHREHLLQQIISTTQVFTMELVEEPAVVTLFEDLCLRLCQYLAGQTKGYYQVDGKGFFAGNGVLLIEEKE